MNKPFALSLCAIATALSLASATAQAGEEVAVQSTVATAPAVNLAAGRALYSAHGGKIGSIYKVTKSGQVQLIVDGRMVSLPVADLTEVDGKIVTALTRRELKSR